MENIDSIILPDLAKSKKSTKPPKPNKVVLVEKETLPRINRTVVCNYCESDKILNPDQYQTLFDLHESEEKLKLEFMCKPCEMSMKTNPIRFWILYGEQMHVLARNLKIAFDLFKNSRRTPADALSLQTMSNNYLIECKIFAPNYEFITENQLPIAMAIKNIPYVGTVNLKVYEPRKSRIEIV